MQVRTLVVGSGVAGMGVAWALRDDPDVLVVDGRPHVGGNVRTVEVAGRPVDMGFIVCNDVTYPRLLGLFDDLDVATVASDMSLSVQLADGREWAGSLGGLLARGRWRDRRSWRRLGGILALRRRAHALAAPGVTVGDVRDRLGAAVVDDYLAPMVSAVWSAPAGDVAAMPVETLVAFFDQHHLFDLLGRPTWRTVDGGARTYVAALRARVAATFATGTRVTGLERVATGWRVATQDGGVVDAARVVLATSAPTARALLGAAATPDQAAVLGAFRSTRNRAVLHGDRSVMPAGRDLWSSWNVVAGEHVAVSYWMNRLQPWLDGDDLFVSLNPRAPLDDVHHDAWFDHPVLDGRAIEAQDRLHTIQGVNDAWVCGAWTGYGFHEDGLESGLAVGAALRGEAPPAAAPRRPAALVVR